MASANIEVRSLTPVIGAEISGVDLAREVDDGTIRDIRQALLDYLVIFLPDQKIGAGDLVAFARRFGEIEPPHPVFDVVPDEPKVTIIEQDGTDASLYNNIWHTDVTFRAEPAMATILHAQILPRNGGDTVWASSYAAYEELSPPIKSLIEDMTAVHDYYGAFGEAVLNGRGGMDKLLQDIRKFPPVEHPVVRTHPETGRKGLFVNRSFTRRIAGLSPVESDYLLRLLCEHAEHPNYQVRRRWRVDDLALWDNRCTMHLATSNFTELRRMHRITLLGDRPYH